MTVFRVSCWFHFAEQLIGTPTLLTSRPDQDGTQVEENLSGGMYGLHDVCAGKSFCCVNRQLRNRFCIGGKDDWLVTTDRVCDLKLLNPISGETISLPPFEIANHVHVNRHHHLEVVYEPFSRTLQRVVLCETPSSRDGHFTIDLFSDGLLLFTSKILGVWKVLI